MHLSPIPSVTGIEKKEFTQQYVKNGQPVILTDFISGSPALEKWDHDYFRAVAGDLRVKVHGKEENNPDWVTTPPLGTMLLNEYLDSIEAGPSELRLFLSNLLLERPVLKKDLKVRKIIDHLLPSLPFLFFGGAGSSVRYHYDIDMSHVFLTQFQGEKKVLLFRNDQSPLLYRLPFNFHGTADLRRPDYDRFPALRYLHGWECTLKFGDTLYIPSGHWHYIQYITAGYSVSHRALSASILERAIGLKNIFITRRIDNLLRKIYQERWYNKKVKMAHKRAAARQRTGKSLFHI
ncbi:MAG: cupin-like domain-containing protein [Chitinophagaceae bacterium]|nr:cupin-like domain-containing protein [Chitinophagaceae bacterium]